MFVGRKNQGSVLFFFVQVLLLLPSSAQARTNRALIHFQLGISPERVKFQQPGTSIDVTDILLNGTGSIHFRFSRTTPLEFAAIYSQTLTQFQHTPSSTDQAGYFSATGLAGLRLIGTESFRTKLLLGGYYWGMNVANDTYGVTQALGIQAYLEFNFIPGGTGRAWKLYGKVTPFGDGDGNLYFSNREVGAGLAWQLTSPKTRYFVFLAYDFSKIDYGVTGEEFKRSSHALGIQIGF